MSACGAFYALRDRVELVAFDSARQAGGHSKTFRFEDGFTFDEGPHISFTANPRVQEILADNIGGQFDALRASINNYWKGHWIKHPVQVNLHGLPTEVIVNSIIDFVAATQKSDPVIENYEDWLIATYGETLARTFPMEYTKKSHTTSAQDLTVDWIGPRMYRPSLEEVLTGALTPATEEVHYIDRYRYPSAGGFFSYVEPFYDRVDLRLNHRAVSVDLSSGVVELSNGHVESFDRLISTVPLPDLVPMVAGAPSDAIDASQRLAASGIVLVNIGIDREEVSDQSWTYFYDDDYAIVRLSYPSGFSRSTVPDGAGSFQAEVYFSDKYKPLEKSPEELIDIVLDDLRRCGLVREDDAILHRSATIARYANIIYDHDRIPSLATVNGFLDETGIIRAGRYGLWGYHWTDDAFLSGEEAALSIIE